MPKGRLAFAVLAVKIFNGSTLQPAVLVLKHLDVRFTISASDGNSPTPGPKCQVTAVLRRRSTSIYSGGGAFVDAYSCFPPFTSRRPPNVQFTRDVYCIELIMQKIHWRQKEQRTNVAATDYRQPAGARGHTIGFVATFA